MISGAVAGEEDKVDWWQAGGGNSNKRERARADDTPTVWLWLFGSPVVRAQLAVTMILVGLVTIMTVWIWRYTTTTQMHEAERMAVPQRLQLLLLTKEKLLGLLRQSVVTNLAIGRTFHSKSYGANSNDFPTVNKQALQVILPVIQSNEQVSAITLLLSNGFLAGISRAKGLLLRVYVDGSGNYTWWTKLIDLETGIDRTNGPIIGQGDLREMQSHKALSEKPDLYTLINVVNVNTVTSLFLGTKIGSSGLHGPPPAHGFHGIVSSYITLDAIGAFMSELDLLGGKMYVSDSKGRLVAVSDGSPAYTVDMNGIAHMLQAEDSPQPVLSGAAKYLNKKFGSHEHLIAAESHQGDVVIDGKKYYVDSIPIVFMTFELLAVVIVPRESFMGAAEKASKKLAIFLGTLAGGVLIVGAIMLMFLTKHMGDKMKLKKELMEQLEANKRAEAAKETSRQFLANLSHDIRTPISAVIGLLDIMQAEELNDEQSTLMEQIQSSAFMLNSILSSILDVSQIESGTFSLTVEPLDIRHELETVVDLFSVEGTKKGVDILLDLPEDIPRVKGDTMRFRQIFSNIISNCVKFTSIGYILVRGSLAQPPRVDDTHSIHDEGFQNNFLYKSSKPEVLFSTVGGRRRSKHITVAPVCGTGETASLAHTRNMSRRAFVNAPRIASFMFEVEDTGSDVPSSQEDAIFEDFILLPDSNSQYGGQRFGLGIVRSLVQIMGGTISLGVKTTPGALFQFTLSFLLDEEQEQKSFARSELQPMLQNLPSTKRLCELPKQERSNKTVSIILAMPSGMHTNLTSKWFRTRGHLVSQAASLNTIPLHVDELQTDDALQPGANNVVDDPDRQVTLLVVIDYSFVQEPQDDFFKPDTLHPFIDRIRPVNRHESKEGDVVIVWAMPLSSPITHVRAVRQANCLVVQKPLLATRLTKLLSSIVWT